MTPPYAYPGPLFKFLAESEEGLLTWIYFWANLERIRDALHRGLAPLEVLNSQDIFDIWGPELDDATKQMLGAMMKSVAGYEGYRPYGRKKLRDSIWKKVARFVPIESAREDHSHAEPEPPPVLAHVQVPPSVSIEARPEADPVHRLLLDIDAKLVRLARHMGLELSELEGV